MGTLGESLIDLFYIINLGYYKYKIFVPQISLISLSSPLTLHPVLKVSFQRVSVKVHSEVTAYLPFPHREDEGLSVHTVSFFSLLPIPVWFVQNRVAPNSYSVPLLFREQKATMKR